VICGLARAKENDIKACAEAVPGRPAPLSTPSSPPADSSTWSTNCAKEQKGECWQNCREMAFTPARLLRMWSFSCEDCRVRSDPEYLYEVIEAAIAAGATTINYPDTVGNITPSEFGA